MIQVPTTLGISAADERGSTFTSAPIEMVNSNQSFTIENQHSYITSTKTEVMDTPSSAFKTELEPNSGTFPSCSTVSVKDSISITCADDLIEPPVGRGPFRCPTCNKAFLKWPQLRRHKLEHLDEKLHKCTLCSETFNYEENLKIHMLIHEAETTGCLQCQLCPTKFSRLASLKSHLRVHEKEENIVCQECGDEFPTKARLETHLGINICETVSYCLKHAFHVLM